MIDQLSISNQGMHVILGICSMLALIGGFLIAFAELVMKRYEASIFKNMLLEIMSLGAAMIVLGFIVPEFSPLIAAGIAVMLVLWPLAYAVIYVYEKQERNGIRLIAAALFSIYLLMGVAYLLV